MVHFWVASVSIRVFLWHYSLKLCSDPQVHFSCKSAHGFALGLVFKQRHKVPRKQNGLLQGGCYTGQRVTSANYYFNCTWTVWCHNVQRVDLQEKLNWLTSTFCSKILQIKERPISRAKSNYQKISFVVHGYLLKALKKNKQVKLSLLKKLQDNFDILFNNKPFFLYPVMQE